MKYDLVFEGGGAKGMVFVGAMQVFESLGHTHGRLLGTSAGAITAAMVAAGYRSDEMLAALGEQENGQPVFADFMGAPKPLTPAEVRNSETRAWLRRINAPFIPDAFEERFDDQLAEWLAAQPLLVNVFSFIELGGWFSADNFLAWLKRKLDTGTNASTGKARQYSALNLLQFYHETDCEISLIGSDTTGEEMLVLNHRTAPDLPLPWAVRMSMSVPLLWQSVVWQPEWGRYRGRDVAGHEIVDGGLLSNFPIELFVSDDREVVDVMGEQTSDAVLGMLIDESLEVPGATGFAADPTAPDVSQYRALKRVLNLANTALSAHDKMVIDAFEKLVMRLPAKGYGTTEFDMSEERRRLLVRAGFSTAKSYFDALAAEAAATAANTPLGDVSFDTSGAATVTLAAPEVVATAQARPAANKHAAKMLSRKGNDV